MHAKFVKDLLIDWPENNNLEITCLVPSDKLMDIGRSNSILASLMTDTAKAFMIRILNIQDSWKIKSGYDGTTWSKLWLSSVNKIKKKTEKIFKSLITTFTLICINFNSFGNTRSINKNIAHTNILNIRSCLYKWSSTCITKERINLKHNCD